jgi:RNA polymerase sigma-70 factor (ECF subfamily)
MAERCSFAVLMITIDAIRSGGEAAFAEVFNHYYAKVYHYFLKKTRSAATARDLAQLTFIKLWEYRHTLTAEHTLDTQLFRMASGALVDHLRREQSLKNTLVQLVAELPEEVAATDTDSFEQDDYLHTLTRHLSPVRKRVFILSRIHGHSYKEIAEKLSISRKTVEDHMVKALRQLRQIASHLLWMVVIIVLAVILT